MHSSLCMWWSKACTWCAICRADVGFVSHTSRYSSLINHYHNCPEWSTRCPNSCNPYLTLTQSSVDGHLKEECPETNVECKFAELGCEQKMKRKDLTEHLSVATSAHLTVIFEELMKMKHEKAELKR